MRIKATIAYDGSAFDGFQKQKHTQRTVAQVLEDRLKSIGIDTKIVASGRTDKGVHATGQVIHFDIPPYWQDTDKLHQALSSKLECITIQKLEKCTPDFHARYSAKRRRYRYICKTSAIKVFEQRYISPSEPFCTQRLQEALNVFRGEHDFINYCKYNKAYTNTKRRLFKSLCYAHKGYHIITLEANGFLHSQVRMIVHDAFKFAQGKIELEDITQKLNSNTTKRKNLAPPNGLYLAKVFY